MSLQYWERLGVLLPGAKCHQVNCLGLADAASGSSWTPAWSLSAACSTDEETEGCRGVAGRELRGAGSTASNAALLPWTCRPEKQTPPQGHGRLSRVRTGTDGWTAGCRGHGALSPNTGQLPSFRKSRNSGTKTRAPAPRAADGWLTTLGRLCLPRPVPTSRSLFPPSPGDPRPNPLKGENQGDQKWLPKEPERGCHGTCQTPWAGSKCPCP